MSIEARHLSETDVSGGGSDGYGGVNGITSSTTHFNRCRVKWDDGQESFVDLKGDYSVGDKLVLIYNAKGETATDLNLNTGNYRAGKIDPPWYAVTAQVVGIILVLGMVLFRELLTILGLILAIGGTVYSKRYTSSYTRDLKAYVDSI